MARIPSLPNHPVPHSQRQAPGPKWKRFPFSDTVAEGGFGRMFLSRLSILRTLRAGLAEFTVRTKRKGKLLWSASAGLAIVRPASAAQPALASIPTERGRNHA